MAATLLPDTSHALHRIIRGGIDRRPSRTAIVGGGDERIPFARKTRCLVISGHITAEETNCGAARGASDGFDFGGVDDAMRRTKIEIVRPSNLIPLAMTDNNACVTFWRKTRCHRLVVHLVISSPWPYACDQASTQ